MKKKDLKVLSFKNREDLKAIRIYVVMLENGLTGHFFPGQFYFDEEKANIALDSHLGCGYVESKLVWL